MPLLPLGPAGDAFAAAFGMTVAVLLVGGPLALRWQRSRYQFALARTALDKGITRFPLGPPFWLLSLRQGITALTLGVALFIIGSAACWLTWGIQPPAPDVTQPPAPNVAATAPVAGPKPADLAPAGPGRLAPPPPNLAMEEWHRLKTINTLGLMSMASGFVLTLLGIVRIAFAQTERRYCREEDQQAGM